ncbi:Uncharacterised protein [Achromobacter sp. 2789STDY5608621]|nr:Uncharacterised protein [Achromobacter sp. 2789STDY5608621]
MSAWPTEPSPSITGVTSRLRNAAYCSSTAGCMPAPPNSAVFRRISMAARVTSRGASAP